jgi:hypothetical protein
LKTKWAAVAQLRAFEGAYRAAAEQWLRTPAKNFCFFGWSYQWDGKPAEGARVDYSLARYWILEAAELPFDCIQNGEIVWEDRTSQYVEILLCPIWRSYGYLYAPLDSAAHRTWMHWAAAKNSLDGRRVVALGGPWFYFEGYWRGSPRPPLSEVKGRLIEDAGAPAQGFTMELIRDGERRSVRWAKTGQEGAFRFDAIAAGRYTLGTHGRRRIVRIDVPELAVFDTGAVPLPPVLSER